MENNEKEQEKKITFSDLSIGLKIPIVYTWISLIVAALYLIAIFAVGFYFFFYP